MRQYLSDNLRSGQMQGYDPQQDDPSASDFLPVTSEWTRGDYYPMIVVQETEGPTIPNSGVTNFNGLDGTGAGPTQTSNKAITVSVQAVGERTASGLYRNGATASEIIHDIYWECHHQVQQSVGKKLGSSDLILHGMTPPTKTRNPEETDGGSTRVWTQNQGTVETQFIDEP